MMVTLRSRFAGTLALWMLTVTHAQAGESLDSLNAPFYSGILLFLVIVGAAIWTRPVTSSAKLQLTGLYFIVLIATFFGLALLVPVLGYGAVFLLPVPVVVPTIFVWRSYRRIRKVQPE